MQGNASQNMNESGIDDITKPFIFFDMEMLSNDVIGWLRLFIPSILVSQIEQRSISTIPTSCPI